MEEVFFMNGSSCMRPSGLSYDWNPQFYSTQDMQEVEPPSNLKVLYSFPLCANWYALNPNQNPDDEYKLLDNGVLYTPGQNVEFEPTHYCMDNFISERAEFFPLVCFPEVEPVVSCHLYKDIYATLMVISCLFLAITVAIYLVIPELHANVHGKSLISHNIALLIASICLVVVQWASQELTIVGCKAMGTFVQLGFLSAFFWLNVMCYDIWRVLTSMKRAAETAAKKRFLRYSLYAWGTPLVISTVTIIMDTLPPSVDTSGLILPEFGDRGCWFGSRKTRWIYFYGFVLVLVLTNTLFFCHVASTLVKTHRKTARSSSRSQQTKERIWLYLKLFLVMGISWLFEVASDYEGSCKGWIATDVINSLRGLFIFIIFVCKKSVLEKLKCKRKMPFQRMKKIRISSTSTKGSKSTSTVKTHSSLLPPEESQGCQDQVDMDNEEQVKLNQFSESGTEDTRQE